MLDYADIYYMVMFRISIGILVQDIIIFCDCSNVEIAKTANK